MHIEIYFEKLAYMITGAGNAASWKVGLVVENSLSFCLSVKIFISSSFPKNGFAVYSILGWYFFLSVL